MQSNTLSFIRKETYSDENETEFTIFSNDSKVVLGYYIIRADSIEVYYSPDDENEDFSNIDFVNSTEEALQLILSAI